MKLQIGFIILTWNSENVILPCLDSIYKMKEIDPWVVIIDNGSTDSTKRLILELDYSTLKLIQNETNIGISKARNMGIKYFNRFKLDYYCFLDSDTMINSTAFLIMHEEMMKHLEYGVCGPKMRTSSGIIQKSARVFPTIFEKICKACPNKRIQKIGEQIENAYESKECTSYPVDYIMGACMLVRPNAMKKVEMFDEHIFYGPEDAEFCIRIWENGFQVAFCPEAEIIHEWQRISKRKLISKTNYEHIKGLIYMFYKHKYLFSTKKLKERMQENCL